jgi:hypothetical protein
MRVPASQLGDILKTTALITKERGDLGGSIAPLC